MNHPKQDHPMSIRLGEFDWDDMRYFLAVARSGTIRGGAASIRANHATVSRRIAALETGMQARLFDRTQTGIQLTQLGEDLLPYAQQVEDQMSAASRTVAGRDLRPVGPVRLSIPPFLATSSIIDDLADFAKSHEDIELHLHVSDQFADFDRREADVSIRYSFDVVQDVVGRKLVHCANAAYCSPAYAAHIQDDGGAGLKWIGWMEDATTTNPAWITDSQYPNAKLAHRVPEVLAQMNLAASGVGLTMVPCFVGDRHPGLVRAPFQKSVPGRSLWLLLHSDLRNTARIRLFVDFLAARILARRSEFET
jgi:DNA-binding transcriptional LysR family regulator